MEEVGISDISDRRNQGSILAVEYVMVVEEEVEAVLDIWDLAIQDSIVVEGEEAVVA